MAAMESQFSGSDVVLQQPNTLAFVQGRELGPGLLTVDESNLTWLSDDQSDKLSLEYPEISIHAVSRDTSTFPHQCVYLLHCPLGDSGEEGEEEEEEEKGEGPASMREIRLVPPDANQLDAIFQAISECQALYPDPEAFSSDEEGGEGEEEGVDLDPHGGDFFTSPEGVEHLSAEGQAVLAHLERVFQMPGPEEFAQMVANGDSPMDEGQFEDAD